MYTATSILEKGFFPEELPPPFSTVRFAEVISKNKNSLLDPYSQGKEATKLVKFNLARVGTIRRELGIPNPTNFCALCLWIEDNQSILGVSSPLSLSSPNPGKGFRAIGREFEISDLDVHRSQFRPGNVSSSKPTYLGVILPFIHTVSPGPYIQRQLRNYKGPQAFLVIFLIDW